MITPEMLDKARIFAIRLKALKVEEMALRRVIAEELGKDLDIGTHNFEQDGFKIKLKLGVGYSLDQAELQYAMDEGFLAQEELDLIRTKYDLKLAEYKAAGFNTETLDEYIIVKPSAPSLEIVLGE